MKRAAGFTLVELVVVITTLGVLSAIAVPRLLEINDYKERAAYDEVASAVRYAQKLAVASGCEVQVSLAGGGYSLQQHSTSCTSGSFVTISGHPVTSHTYSDVTLTSTPTLLTFDAMGRSSHSATITVGSKTIQLVAETGYVDAQ